MEIQVGPERCALAANVTTARELNTKVRGLLDDLVSHPLPVPHATRPGLLKSSDVRGALAIALKMTYNSSSLVLTTQGPYSPPCTSLAIGPSSPPTWHLR